MPDIRQKTQIIPDWMLSPNQIHNQSKKINRSFLTKTLNKLSFVMQNEIFGERFVNQKGYLQAIDPRVKLITILIYLLLSSSTNSSFLLILLAFLAGLFIKLSRLDGKDFLKRVWLVFPLFVLVLSLPAATNWFIKGEPMIFLYRSANVEDSLYLSAVGLEIVFRMAMRVGVSLSFVYLLILTTGWSATAKALTMFKVPALFVTLLHMTYRFLFILAKTAAERMEARMLRTVGSVKNKSNRKFVAHGISFLFLKANFLSGEIYDAMRCRGFGGELVSLKQFQLTRADWLWMANHVIILFILWIGEWIY